jgi:hypothetical protein
METEKEKRIEAIMSSLDGMQPAEPAPFLYNKILNKISEKSREYTPMKLVWLAAASFVLLILLNWQIVRSSGKNAAGSKGSVEQLADQYQLLSTNPVSYN